MVFSSLLFVFFFFAIYLIVYGYVDDIHRKNIVLLVFSLIFYAWGGPKYLILLVGMSFVSWYFALMIERSGRDMLMRNIWLIGACVADLGLLVYFKYTTFFLENIHHIFGIPETVPKIVLPIGISFYTFQLLSYVIDVYKREVRAQKKFWLLLLYASMFFQCIAGPIVRYQDVADEIKHRKVKKSEIGKGINRFVIGLFKKAVLANGCASIAVTFLPTSMAELKVVPATGIWLGMIMFTLQIYLDFSAYSDMAIGMGLMAGFHFKENFNYPYISASVTEFWRRWHISLSSFFRDYVYIPLGGNRKGRNRTFINLFIVWGLTGMWHGASWNFIIWGLFYFAFLMLEKNYLAKRLESLPIAVSHIYTLAVVNFGWLIFNYTDMSLLGTAIKGIFGLNGNGFINLTVRTVFSNNLFFMIVAVLAVTPLAKQLYGQVARMGKTSMILKYVRHTFEIAGPPILLLISTMALVGNSYNPFLYFQF